MMAGMRTIRLWLGLNKMVVGPGGPLEIPADALCRPNEAGVCWGYVRTRRDSRLQALLHRFRRAVRQFFD